MNLELYKTMYLIRRSEDRIRELYPEDEMKTPMHMSIGSEAIYAGIIHALKKEDQVFGTYRSHALYLAKTGDTDGFFGELYGKSTGCSRGRAGSMHLTSPENGLMGTSAVVGTTIPIAVGTAFANVYKGEDKRVVVFFGDGALDEGVFWESFNFACLKKLPIIFVCEDNGLAIHSSKIQRQGYHNIGNILKEFNCFAYDLEDFNPIEILDKVKLSIAAQDIHKVPLFLHCFYYRYLEHVGVGTDFHFGYRKDETKSIKDPLKLLREKLSEEVDKVEEEINQQIERSIELAKNASFPDKNELLTDVYA